MSFDIVNIDKYCGGKVGSCGKHGQFLPDHVRAIICGPSNSGKTNLMLNLIFNKNGLKFENIYIFSKSLYQDKYRFLESVISEVPEIGFYAYSDNDELPHPSDLQPNSVMIFDDVSCEKQSNIKSYFTMGRHNKVDTFYLCQTYSSVPKQLVRDNANFLVLFRQDGMNLRHVYHDHVDPDMTLCQFTNVCNRVWNCRNNSFLVIDKEKDIDCGRYRHGIDVDKLICIK